MLVFPKTKLFFLNTPEYPWLFLNLTFAHCINPGCSALFTKGSKHLNIWNVQYFPAHSSHDLALVSDSETRVRTDPQMSLNVPKFEYFVLITLECSWIKCGVF